MTELFSSASFSQPKNTYPKLNNLFTKQEHEGSSNTKIQYKGEGKMLGFHHTPQVFPCLDCMGWNVTNPDRHSTGKHQGRCCKMPGSSKAAGKCHHRCPRTHGERAGRAGTWPCPHFCSSQQSWTDVKSVRHPYESHGAIILL